MVFVKTNCTSRHVTINGTEIEEVNSTKFLGVFIDNKLKWDIQIKHVQSKISKNISILYRVKNLLDASALLTLYNTLVLLYLTYCVEAWGNTYPTNLMCIIKLQKRAVRIIGNVGYCDHTNPIFISLNLLKFVDLVKLKTSVLMYKCYYGLLNERFNKLFSVNSNNTRQK